ncbi:hypothetical protein CAPTEDRAFT_187289 [Capitella teleta]|uniref:CARD domain-containing protein n=1 Tax=Capitella teleta TaxID=283909 RepID=X1ZK43_CAPTE|nr:hypothetical protein CAPTEDRAFT_187289 [Capitella teleta]|eukprot:ELU10124.1 hypothetical protein CAPTEDRAFT_187289 [Capitella teleta]
MAEVLPKLRVDNSFTKKDEEAIMSDPRRRERVIKFLDLMEKKKTEVYHRFLDIIENHFPHIFLMITDDWKEEDSIHTMDEPIASHACLDDDWSGIHNARPFLIKEVDAVNIIQYMRSHDAIDDEEMALVQKEKDRYKRTEAFLDILEMKPHAFNDIFMDALGETYPHVYLAMSGDKDILDDDDDDDLYDPIHPIITTHQLALHGVLNMKGFALMSSSEFEYTEYTDYYRAIACVDVHMSRITECPRCQGLA